MDSTKKKIIKTTLILTVAFCVMITAGTVILSGWMKEDPQLAERLFSRKKTEGITQKEIPTMQDQGEPSEAATTLNLQPWRPFRVILNSGPFEVEQGNPVSLEEVVAGYEGDSPRNLFLDTSGADFSTPGNYELTVVAMSNTGTRYTKTVKVKVKEPEKKEPGTEKETQVIPEGAPYYEEYYEAYYEPEPDPFANEGIILVD